jgi:hypothetical protein
MSRLLLAGALALSFASHAQVVADDFESGTLSMWSVTATATCQLSANPQAAHRGNYGVRLVDTLAGTGPPVICGTAENRFSSRVGSGAYYARAWVRQTTASPGAGPYVTFASIQSSDVAAAGSWSLAAMEMSGPDDNAHFWGQDRATGGGGDPRGVSLTDGGWHLFEWELNGVATSDAGHSLWVDGVLRAEGAGADISGWGPDRFLIGEVYSFDDWAGSFDFDDVRASTVPPASHFVVTAPLGARVGGCQPLAVSLQSAGGLPSAPPYELDAVLACDGGELFADSACGSSTAIAHLGPTTPSTTAYLRPGAAGSVRVTASHPDLLPGGAELMVAAAAADAGVAPARLTVGCGCRSSEGLPWLSAALLAGLLLRRNHV